MQPEPAVVPALNGVLKEALTLINQAFLHARMLGNWGFEHLGEHDYHQSIRAMKQADTIIQRVLFLEGLPNLQALGALRIGENVPEILAADLATTTDLQAQLVAAIDTCERAQDFESREQLKPLLEAAEEAIDFLETQQSLLAELGTENYLQSQVEHEED